MHLCRNSSVFRASSDTASASDDICTIGSRPPLLPSPPTLYWSKQVYVSGPRSAAFAVCDVGAGPFASGMAKGCSSARSEGDTMVWPCAARSRWCESYETNVWQ